MLIFKEYLFFDCVREMVTGRCPHLLTEPRAGGLLLPHWDSGPDAGGMASALTAEFLRSGHRSVCND